MPAPPLENCPDVEDCLADPSEIGRVCTFAPLCGTCAVYRVIEGRRGLLLGTCRIRTERGEFPCTAPVCDSYLPRAGARPAPLIQIAKAPRPRSEREPPPPRRKIPDGPVGEVEMTREELKELIREAMDEERGGGVAPLAPKWEGGTALLKPGDPALQAKELPLEVGAALLASAEGYTPKATRLIEAAREELATVEEVAAALAENLPQPKLQSRSRRRRRRKKRGRKPQEQATQNGAQPDTQPEAAEEQQPGQAEQQPEPAAEAS